jgi:hypothetical protein
VDITGHRIGTSLVRNQEVASSILARSTKYDISRTQRIERAKAHRSSRPAKPHAEA